MIFIYSFYKSTIKAFAKPKQVLCFKNKQENLISDFTFHNNNLDNILIKPYCIRVPYPYDLSSVYSFNDDTNFLMYSCTFSRT